MEDLLVAFADELEKIAVELNKKERAVQALQFGAMGAATAPIVKGITNRIEHGKFMNLAPGGSKSKWLASHLVGGALAGGALPVLRHHLEQKNLEAAKVRTRAGRT